MAFKKSEAKLAEELIVKETLEKEIEENKKIEAVIAKKKEEARTLPVMFRGSKEVAVIKKSEYDSDLHICI